MINFSAKNRTIEYENILYLASISRNCFIYLFIHLFIYLCIHLFIYSFIYLFIYLFIHSFIRYFKKLTIIGNIRLNIV